MTPEIIGGIVRLILAAIGGIFVTKGWTDNGTVETIIGAVTTLVVGIWSIWAKIKANKKLEAAKITTTVSVTAPTVPNLDKQPLNPL